MYVSLGIILSIQRCWSMSIISLSTMPFPSSSGTKSGVEHATPSPKMFSFNQNNHKSLPSSRDPSSKFPTTKSREALPSSTREALPSNTREALPSNTRDTFPSNTRRATSSVWSSFGDFNFSKSFLVPIKAGKNKGESLKTSSSKSAKKQSILDEMRLKRSHNGLFDFQVIDLNKPFGFLHEDLEIPAETLQNFIPPDPPTKELREKKYGLDKPLPLPPHAFIVAMDEPYFETFDHAKAITGLDSFRRFQKLPFFKLQSLRPFFPFFKP